MFFLHQVVASTESHQVCIVGWGWNGHRPCAAHIGVTQLVGQDLQLIGCEAVVIPKHVVVRRSTRTLQEKNPYGWWCFRKEHICKNCTCSAEIRIRIASAMAKLNKIWPSNTISFASKFKLYNFLVTSILL